MQLVESANNQFTSKNIYYMTLNEFIRSEQNIKKNTIR